MEERQYWKSGNMVYPVPAVMVSCGKMDINPNIITIAWAGTCCTNPAMAYISVRPERHSYKLIKETNEFVINLVTKDLAYACDYCGVKSGKDIDKFKEMKLTQLKSKHVSAPSILESPVNIECKVNRIIPLGSHDMILADVLGVSVDPKYLDENNKFNLNKADLIAYSHGEYFTLGELIGKFGYSVKKKK